MTLKAKHFQSGCEHSQKKSHCSSLQMQQVQELCSTPVNIVFDFLCIEMTPTPIDVYTHLLTW